MTSPLGSLPTPCWCRVSNRCEASSCGFHKEPGVCGGGGGGEHTCPCCTRSKSSQMPCLQSCFEPCSQSLYLDSHWGPYVSGVQSHLLVIQEHSVRVCAFNTRSCLLASVRNVPPLQPKNVNNKPVLLLCQLQPLDEIPPALLQAERRGDTLSLQIASWRTTTQCLVESQQ